MENSLTAKSELFDELHPSSLTTTHYDLPPRPHTVMSGNLHSSRYCWYIVHDTYCMPFCCVLQNVNS